MRTIPFVLAIAALTVPSLLFAEDVDHRIALIRAEVAAIHDGAERFEQRSVEVEGISLEGAEATCFTDDGTLRKITAKIYGETYHASLELFFQERELIFAFQRTSRYDTQIGLDTPPEIATVEDHRFYFSGGSLFRCLLGTEAIEPGSEQFSDLERSTQGIADSFKQACEE